MRAASACWMVVGIGGWHTPSGAPTPPPPLEAAHGDADADVESRGDGSMNSIDDENARIISFF